MAQWYEAVHTTKRFRLGTEKTDIAGNKYVYLAGVSSLAAGDWVSFNASNFTAVRLAANAIGKVGVSMSANTSATNYSWFQVYGKNTIAKSDSGVVSGAALYIDATTGRADDTVVAGDLIAGAFAASADTSNVISAMLNNPFCTDTLS